MKIYGKSRPNESGQELHFQAPSKCTKASLTLFIISAALVLLDIVGPIVLSGGHDIISGRLHDQLAFLALLSVPCILIPLLVIGSRVGILGWRAEHKASGRPSRMAVVATCLNLVSLLIAALVVGRVMIDLCMFNP